MTYKGRAIAAVVARAHRGVIGASNAVPWYLPADLRHFKAITMGHTLIMGRKTFESIGRALPGRQNVVLSRNDDLVLPPGVEKARDIDHALQVARGDVYVIGGQDIYEQYMPYIDTLYVTDIDAEISGDKVFLFDESEWRVLSRTSHAPDEKNPYAYTFTTYTRATRSV